MPCRYRRRSAHDDLRVRSPADLIELPYVFWQQPLLTVSKFRAACRERGLHLSESDLETLHRLRLLVPFLRVRRDGRAVAAAIRGDDPWKWEVAHRDLNAPEDIAAMRQEGRLRDPAGEHFIARRRLDRRVGDVTYRSSIYLYSPYQLICLQMIRDARPHIVGQGTKSGFGDIHPAYPRSWRKQADALRGVAVVTSALEPIYWPRIRGRISYRSEEQFADYERWLERQPPLATLSWLDVSAGWLREQAKSLLWHADRIDPLGRWFELVRLAPPESWERLRGAARTAIDLRLAAELLLRYYERLVRTRRAPALPKPEMRAPDEFPRRLKREGSLDPVLTNLGISPHPRLLLVLEGETEMLIVPRVMAHFGIRQDPDLIALVNRQGVGKDLNALVAHAVAPAVERDKNGRYLRPLRPLTRMLVLTDPEGDYRDPENQAKAQRVWVERILQTLPQGDRTQAVRESIERMVLIRTWNARGESFEFAHFTDRQLATAALAVDNRQRPMTQEKAMAGIGRLRERGGNLNSILGGGGKPALADELWPVLERKIERAEERGTKLRIPVVRRVQEALDLAHEWPRGRLVIPLHER